MGLHDDLMKIIDDLLKHASQVAVGHRRGQAAGPDVLAALAASSRDEVAEIRKGLAAGGECGVAAEGALRRAAEGATRYSVIL